MMKVFYLFRLSRIKFIGLLSLLLFAATLRGQNIVSHKAEIEELPLGWMRCISLNVVSRKDFQICKKGSMSCLKETLRGILYRKFTNRRNSFQEKYD